MDFTPSAEVSKIIESYPDSATVALKQLRELILDTAEQTDGVTKLLETTKWGEPSYVANGGSTIRMDWKEKTPDRYYLFFICSTQLVENFRLIFGDELTFEGDRAIVLRLDEDLPIEPIRKCLELGLTYHKVKNLPFLGVK